MSYLYDNGSIIYRKDSLYTKTNMNTSRYRYGKWYGADTEHSWYDVYMLEKQAVIVMLWYNKTTSYLTSIWTAVQPEHQQFVTYMLEKQAVMVMLWYNETSHTQHQYRRRYNWNTSSS